MTNTKLILTSIIAFVMIAMTGTTIITQVYADPFCGMNYQGSFHLSVGDPSLSIPPGYPPYTPLCIPDNSLSASYPISDH